MCANEVSEKQYLISLRLRLMGHDSKEFISILSNAEKMFYVNGFEQFNEIVKRIRFRTDLQQDEIEEIRKELKEVFIIALS